MNEINIPIRVEVTDLTADVIQRILSAFPHMADLTLVSEFGKVLLDGFLDLPENTAPKEDLDPTEEEPCGYACNSIYAGCPVHDPASDPEPETVTVTLPRDVVERAREAASYAKSASREAGNVGYTLRMEALERALVAADGSQS